jgi:hypothetical protein
MVNLIAAMTDVNGVANRDESSAALITDMITPSAK